MDVYSCVPAVTVRLLSVARVIVGSNTVVLIVHKQLVHNLNVKQLNVIKNPSQVAAIMPLGSNVILRGASKR